jgi:hypothetical protein
LDHIVHVEEEAVEEVVEEVEVEVAEPERDLQRRKTSQLKISIRSLNSMALKVLMSLSPCKQVLLIQSFLLRWLTGMEMWKWLRPAQCRSGQ